MAGRNGGFKDRFRVLRILNGLTQTDLAARSGIPQQQIACWEIRLKLQRLGVGADDIKDALDTQNEEIDVVGALSESISRRFPDFDPAIRDQKSLQRVCGHYQRKGYSWSQILAAFKLLKEE